MLTTKNKYLRIFVYKILVFFIALMMRYKEKPTVFGATWKVKDTVEKNLPIFITSYYIYRKVNLPPRYFVSIKNIDVVKKEKKELTKK